MSCRTAALDGIARILLGTNGVNLAGPAAAVAQHCGSQIMTAKVPAKVPGAYIGVKILSMARSLVGDTKWREAYDTDDPDNHLIYRGQQQARCSGGLGHT